MFQTDQRIGPYTLKRKIGSGGFGEVWLAKRNDVMAAPEVALKMPLDDQADLDTIRREAEMWVNATGHPNVLPVIEANVYDGQVVIVSEYVAGGTLSHWLLKYGGKAPSVESAVEITASILAGLHHLHTRTPLPIVHCDLKPDNIMMQGEIPRLTDFGISRVSKTTAYTRQFTGTLAYMSPEAFKGGYPPQRDLWAVGVILYGMLTGLLPFPQDDAPQTMAAILTEEPAALPETLPLHIRNVVQMALAKDLLQRFASAAEMRAALMQTPFVSQRADRPQSQKHTVVASALPLPSQKQTVVAAIAPLRSQEAATIAGPVAPTAHQDTIDSRAVPLAPRQVKIISAKQAKLDIQKSNRRTLTVLAGLGALSLSGWAFATLRAKPARPVVSTSPSASNANSNRDATVSGQTSGSGDGQQGGGESAGTNNYPNNYQSAGNSAGGPGTQQNGGYGGGGNYQPAANGGGYRPRQGAVFGRGIPSGFGTDQSGSGTYQPAGNGGRGYATQQRSGFSGFETPQSGRGAYQPTTNGGRFQNGAFGGRPNNAFGNTGSARGFGSNPFGTGGNRGIGSNPFGTGGSRGFGTGGGLGGAGGGRGLGGTGGGLGGAGGGRGFGNNAFGGAGGGRGIGSNPLGGTGGGRGFGGTGRGQGGTGGGQ